jgi:hypothetical protein
VTLGTSHVAGGLMGYKKDVTVDEVARKEYMRKNRRRSVDEIVNELGEGRGESYQFPALTLYSLRDANFVSVQASQLPATRRGGHSALRRRTASMYRLHRAWRSRRLRDKGFRL